MRFRSVSITGSLTTNGLIITNRTGLINQVLSTGGLTSDMSNLSGSTGFRYIPAGYQTYYLNSNESYNSKATYFLYNLTSNGSNPSNPFYSSAVTIINKAGGNVAWILPNSADIATSIQTVLGNYTSQSVAPSSYMTLFVDYESPFPQWVVLASGSLFASGSSNTSTINTGSFATTGSNSFFGNQRITGSLIVTGSGRFSGQVVGTSTGGVQTGGVRSTVIASYFTATDVFSMTAYNPDGAYLGWDFQGAAPASGSGNACYQILLPQLAANSQMMTGCATSTGKIPKVLGGNQPYQYLADSSIFDTGTLLTLGTNTVVSGSLTVTGATNITGSLLVSGSIFQTGSLSVSGSIFSNILTASLAVCTIANGQFVNYTPLTSPIIVAGSTIYMNGGTSGALGQTTLGVGSANGGYYSTNIGANSYSSGCQSTAIGYNAGGGAIGGNATGAQSFFGGVNSGMNSSGARTIYIGVSAGYSTTGNDSIYMGYYAGGITSNTCNVNFLGYYAGQCAQNAYSSNFLGNQAGCGAQNSNNSNFFGQNTGFLAIGASNSNFFGQTAGYGTNNASNSNFFGFQAGYATGSAPTVGANNIIIGTNLTLPSLYANGVNIGGLIFGSGSYKTITGNPFSGSANGFVGINQPNPLYTLDINGNTNITGSLVVTGSSITTGGASFNGPFTGSYSDGILVDYINGVGRIAVGASDSIVFYNGFGGTTSSLFYLSASSQVGIGTLTPKYTLDISGSSNISGNLTVSGSIIGSITNAITAQTASFSTGLNMAGNVLPITNASYNIGVTAQRFGSINTVYADFNASSTLTTVNIGRGGMPGLQIGGVTGYDSQKALSLFGINPSAYFNDGSASFNTNSGSLTLNASIGGVTQPSGFWATGSTAGDLILGIRNSGSGNIIMATSNGIRPGVDFKLTPAGNVMLSPSSSADNGYTLQVYGSLYTSGSGRFTNGLSITGSNTISGSTTITGSLVMFATGSFILPLTASSGTPLTGTAFFSGSWLFIYNGTKYVSSSFA